jgi:hypothetical protein
MVNALVEASVVADDELWQVNKLVLAMAVSGVVLGVNAAV